MTPTDPALFTVITADVIDSRRQAVKVEEKKNALAAITYPGLLTPFTISRGDEIQAVLAGAVLPLDLVRRFALSLPSPGFADQHRYRRITSGLGSKTSWEMNGPASSAPPSAGGGKRTPGVYRPAYGRPWSLDWLAGAPCS